MAKAKVVSVKHMAKGNNKVDIEYLDPIALKLAYQRIAKEDEVLSKVLERYYPNLDKAVRRAVLSLQDTVLRGIGSGGGGEDEEETSEAFLDTGNVRLKACTPVILPDIYTAAENETPTSIKNTFGCDVNELLTVNRYQTGYEKLASSSKLKEGTQIVIPPCWRPGAVEVQWVPKHRLQRPVGAVAEPEEHILAVGDRVYKKTNRIDDGGQFDNTAVEWRRAVLTRVANAENERVRPPTRRVLKATSIGSRSSTGMPSASVSWRRRARSGSARCRTFRLGRSSRAS